MNETSDHDPVEIPIEDTLDLHSFRPQDTREVALEYLTAARVKGYRQVRLIHGRGLGVQRRIVQSLLSSLDWIESFHDADASGGGWGSTVVLIKPPENVQVRA